MIKPKDKDILSAEFKRLREKNPTLDELSLYKFIYKSIITLKHYIEGPSPEVSWSDPCLFIIYEVKDSLSGLPEDIRETRDKERLLLSVHAIISLCLRRFLPFQPYGWKLHIVFISGVICLRCIQPDKRTNSGKNKNISGNKP